MKKEDPIWHFFVGTESLQVDWSLSQGLRLIAHDSCHRAFRIDGLQSFLKIIIIIKDDLQNCVVFYSKLIINRLHKTTVF